MLLLFWLACVPKLDLPDPPGLSVLEPSAGPSLLLDAQGRPTAGAGAAPRDVDTVEVPGAVALSRIGPSLGGLVSGGRRRITVRSGAQGASFELVVGEGEGSPVPAMELAIWPDRLGWQRGPGPWAELPDLEGKADLRGLLTSLRDDRERVPAGESVGIATAEAVSWSRAQEVLAVVELAGYPIRVLRADPPGETAPAGLPTHQPGWSWELLPWWTVELPGFVSAVPFAGTGLTLGGDGRAWVGRREVPGWAAIGEGPGPLTAALRVGEPITEVRIFADDSVRVGQLRGVMGQVRDAGATRVGLASPLATDRGFPLELRGSVWPAGSAQRGREPLSVELSSDALYVGRGAPLLKLPHVGGGADLTGLTKLLRDEGERGPTLRLYVDDERSLPELTALLETLSQAGFSDPLLTGGVATPRPEAPPVAQAGQPNVPKSVLIGEDGTFDIDGVQVKVADVAGFRERCGAKACELVLVRLDGQAWYLGSFAAPVGGSSFIFQRRVETWNGATPRKPPRSSGTLRTLVGTPQASPMTTTGTTLTQTPSASLPPTTPTGSSSSSTAGAPQNAGPTPSGSGTGTRQTVDSRGGSGDPLTDAVVACYSAALSRNPSSKGKIVVTATVASDGKLLGTVLSSSTLGDSTADQCIVRAVGELAEMPTNRSAGITTVQFPFTLAPG